MLQSPTILMARYQSVPMKQLSAELLYDISGCNCDHGACCNDRNDWGNAYNCRCAEAYSDSSDTIAYAHSAGDRVDF
jgi:hypothetical protein